MWREALETLSFVAIYTDAELARLRELAVMFLSEKSIVGGGNFEVTPLMRVVIAIRLACSSCNLDPRYLDGWENVIVYPDEFVTDLEFEDDAGVVHRRRESLAGEAVLGGPVVLSWPDVQAGADWDSAGMNLVIHEFAHKLDMRSGDANGCPPLPAEMPPRSWQKAMSAAFEHFRARVEKGEETAIDPYACGKPGRVLCRTVRGFLRRPDAAVARVPENLRAFFVVLQAGPREPDRIAARGVSEATPGVLAYGDASAMISAHPAPDGRVPSAPLPKRSRRDAQ